MVDVEVRDLPDRSRYVAQVTEDGAQQEVGFAAYERDGDVVVLTHTVVPPEHEGDGIGSALVKELLDDLRAKGATVRAQCHFVADYVRQHEEYADLLE
jgi:uncharacterized protein